MKTKKFKTTRVNDEVFAFISAACSVLTDLQEQSDEVSKLASNFWNLYYQLGGHDRYYSVRSFSNSLCKKVY